LRAAMFYEPGDVRMEDVPVPEPGRGEVLVRIGAALTCGTDVKTYKRGHPTLITEIPSPFGHEFGGTIETVGEGVENWRPGVRVVAANSAPCNHCYYCKVGDQSMCENLAFLNGAFAEYIVVPERIVQQNLYEIPEGVEYSRAALLEPLACAVHGIVRTPISMGDTVAVIGAGQIGLMFVRLATERGARVVCIDRSSDRLAVARELGAEETIEAAEGVGTIEAVRDWTPEGRGADRVIEAVGLPETWEQALQMVRKGGDVTLFGGAPSGTTMEVDTVLLHYSQITIRGIFHHTPYTVQVAFDLLKSGRVDPEPFISGVRPLEDVVQALEQHGRQEGIKYEIRPPDGESA
jgi:L-iditol 2-dehydrogenase